MSWTIFVTSAAERDITQLSESDRQVVIQTIERLADNPSLMDIGKIKDHKNEWRLRVGRWRVCFTSQTYALKILRVLSKKSAY
jgi:mRNA-degrading endonuclease RelE of RelBE toxin-antitoxin system